MARAAGLLVALVAGAGTWVALNATELRARFAARELTAAATDEERAQWADALIGYGDPGMRHLAACVQNGSDPTRAAAVAAMEKHLDSLPDGDPRALRFSGAVLDALPPTSETETCAVMRLVPLVLKRTGSTYAMRCRGAAAAGLKVASAETRLAAVRLAMHPDIKLRAEVKPLLAAPEPEVRSVALFAVASATDGETLVTDEELFRWLHDADASVRKVCRDALVTRGRSEAEIGLGQRLTHADPAERLKLLLDLRYDEDVADPEPWLERLSRDPEPAVRAGATRVAVELATAHKLTCPAWVARIADADAHPTVRFVAAYYRSQPIGTPGGPIRLIGGPWNVTTSGQNR